MAFTESHWYLVVFGDDYSEEETWQFGLRVRTVASPAPQPTDDDTASALGNFAGPWDNMFLCNRFRWAGIKITAVGTDGLMIPGTHSVTGFSAATPVAGTQNSASITHFPPQCAEAVTLLTDIPRGRGSHGRVYLPPACSTLDETTGGLASSIAAGLQANIATFLNGLNAQTGVLSVAVMSPLGAGVTANVTAVKCGLAVDTQRRRRRSIPEGFPTPDVVTP